jgi:hypothetical protein
VAIYCNERHNWLATNPPRVLLRVWSQTPAALTDGGRSDAGLFNALFFGGMGRVSLKCHTPTQTAQ